MIIYVCRILVYSTYRLHAYTVYIYIYYTYIINICYILFLAPQSTAILRHASSALTSILRGNTGHVQFRLT